MSFSICSAKSRLLLGAMSGLFLLGAGSVRAETVLDAGDNRGWYLNEGLHEASNLSYFTGWDGGNEFRSFFVFNIPVLSEAATSATITLWNPVDGYLGDETETLHLGSISTPIDLLTADYFGTEEGIAIFDDLGAGTDFGSIEVSSADNGVYIVITLNAAGISAINDAQGGQLAVSGVLTTMTQGGAQERVFDNTASGENTGPTAARLIINPVPEPTTAALFAISSGAVLFFRRRKSR